jgi:hypothetical protein
MKMQKIKSIIASIVCIVLIAAMALCITGCEKKGVDLKPFSADATVCGEGNTAFNFSVVDKDGIQTDFFVKTDKTIVGEALLENGLIEGEDSEYGLYVKTVNGITLDYNTDGKYWAFYVNGAYATSGVDTTDIVEGATYTFKAE